MKESECIRRLYNSRATQREIRFVLFIRYYEYDQLDNLQIVGHASRMGALINPHEMFQHVESRGTWTVLEVNGKNG
jgi:hypothetical protein